jgi:uncharacterized protein (TIGR03067 family)
MRTLLSLVILVGLAGAEPPADAVKKDLALLEGEWAMVSGERDGQALPEEYVKTGKRVARDSVSTVTIGDMVILKSKFTIDPAKKPKAIDLVSLEGPTTGQKLHGIYELDGETVRICFASADKDRPTDFTTKEGSGRTLSVWKRVKK